MNASAHTLAHARMHAQVFDANSRSVLRQFKAHKRPTHVARFSPSKLHVLSGSDDVTVRLWDITQGTQVRVIRCVLV